MHIDNMFITDNNSGLLRQPQPVIVQRLVKSLYLALIINYCQLQDREHH